MSLNDSHHHFLDLAEVNKGELRRMIDHAKSPKTNLKQGIEHKPLQGKVMAMIFEKPSTRTRVSFDVGMRQLGGETLLLSGSDMQLGASETVADTARVLSRYVDIIMIRTMEHDRLLEMAEYATVPVINALTDDTHPCQIMADVQTYEEHRGSIEGKTLSWVGDGNNVTHSLMEGAAQFGYSMNIGTPEGSEPEQRYVEWARKNGATINLAHEAEVTVKDTDCVITDKWVSMNQEHKARGHNVFQPFQVNAELMAQAKSDALFMHCLPAKRGEDVTDEVIDGPQSVVFDEAENRMHAQKAIIEWCLGAL
jgi:ornithine carbamoyltransferase